jgi:hypothetical protein
MARLLPGGVAFSAAAVCYAIFSFRFYDNTLTRIGAILSALAFGYMVVYIRLERARAAPHPGETDGVHFYRFELKRRRDWLRWVAW